MMKLALRSSTNVYGFVRLATTTPTKQLSHIACANTDEGQRISYYHTFYGQVAVGRPLDRDVGRLVATFDRTGSV
jgi:hypothetical protein